MNARLIAIGVCLVGLVVLAGCATAGPTTGPMPTTPTTPTMPTTPAPTPPAPAPTPAPTPIPPVPSGGALGPAPGPVDNHATNPQCGTERWAVKTLQDPDAQTVNATPQPTTIAALTQRAGTEPAPAARDAARGPGIERQTFEVHVRLVEAKVERDSDVHLVVTDGQQTMIVEFPSPGCDAGADQTAQQDVAGARRSFVASCGLSAAGGFTRLTGDATITGVGFLDFKHGQTGQDTLPNGADLELHPALSFTGGCAGGKP